MRRLPKGPDIRALVAEHGGIVSVHVHPVTENWRVIGWANTIVCRDGFKRQLTKQDEETLTLRPS